MEEIKRVIAYRESIIGPAGGKVLALCLSSRRNMCIHPRINSEGITPLNNVFNIFMNSY